MKEINEIKISDEKLRKGLVFPGKDVSAFEIMVIKTMISIDKKFRKERKKDKIMMERSKLNNQKQKNIS